MNPLELPQGAATAAANKGFREAHQGKGTRAPQRSLGLWIVCLPDAGGPEHTHSRYHWIISISVWVIPPLLHCPEGSTKKPQT